MPNDEHPRNEGGQIPSQKGSLGGPRRIDPMEPRNEAFMVPESLDNRQNAIDEHRKYAGPVSGAQPESLAEPAGTDPAKPTGCKEPPPDEDQTTEGQTEVLLTE